MISTQDLQHFMAREFPGFKSRIDRVAPNYCKLMRLVDPSDLRPGGTVSGPTMMELADTALYVAVLATVGLIPLAVTSNLHVHFLRKPEAGVNLVGICRLHKVGKTQAVGSVEIFSEGSESMVCHASGTYVIPRA